MRQPSPDLGDHVGALMLSGEGEIAASGRYRAGQWEVFTGGRAGDASVRMVTLHEAMHAALNDTTAWGSLFKAYSALLRYATEPEPYRDICLSLVQACRHTHEVFATYTGVYLADRGAGRSLLAAHRPYLTYCSDACHLSKGMPHGSQLEWYAVISAARACMQSKGLLTALRVGLDRFRLADIRSNDRPDARLALLLFDSDNLWNEVTASITSQLDPADEADALAWLTAEPHAGGADAAGVDEAVLDRAAAIAERVCFDHASAALERHGAEVIGYNGHQAFTDDTIAAVHELAPAAGTAFRAAPADAHEVDKVMQDFALEHLRVREQPQPARVLRLADVPRRHRQQLLRSEDPAGPYTFLVARSAGALRTQHKILDGPRSLPTLDTAPVVAIRTAGGTQDEPALRLWQVRRPGELPKLRRHIGGLGVVSNVSMSLLADTHWESQWLTTLLAAGPVTVLMDLDPFTHFEHWASLGLHVKYASIEMTESSGSRIGFACRCRAPDEDLLYDEVTFLTVCSDMQADALTFVLQHRWPETTREDPDAIRERLDVIRIVLHHLITDETSFAFTGTDLAAEEPGRKL